MIVAYEQLPLHRIPIAASCAFTIRTVLASSMCPKIHANIFFSLRSFTDVFQFCASDLWALVVRSLRVVCLRSVPYLLLPSVWNTNTFIYCSCRVVLLMHFSFACHICGFWKSALIVTIKQQCTTTTVLVDYCACMIS
jgi:hypothetical protein